MSITTGPVYYPNFRFRTITFSGYFCKWIARLSHSNKDTEKPYNCVKCVTRLWKGINSGSINYSNRLRYFMRNKDIWDFQERQWSCKTSRKRVSETWVSTSQLMEMSKSQQSLFLPGYKHHKLSFGYLKGKFICSKPGWEVIKAVASSRSSVSQGTVQKTARKKIKKGRREEARERLWENLTKGRSGIPGSGIPSVWSILTDFVNTRALLTQMRYTIWRRSETFQRVTRCSNLL